MKKVPVILLSLVSFFYFTSCENFLNGSDLKEQLQENIIYANADSITINITQKNEYGTLSASSSGSYKVLQSISNEISFEEAKDYQFVNWRIYDKNNLEIDNGNGVLIATPEAPSTTFSVLDSIADGYTIAPHCEFRPYVTDSSPKYQANGVSRDTEIRIAFDRDLDKSLFTYSYEELVALDVCSVNDENYSLNEDCELLTNPDNSIFGYRKGEEYNLKNISITSHEGEKNLAQYFWKCSLEGSVLKIYPKFEIDERYPLDENNKKDIRVTISNVSDNNIKMRYNYIMDFRTNNSTDVKANIVITSDVFGSISPTGGSYNIGDVIDVKFVLDSDKYIFEEGWEQSDNDTLILGETDYDDLSGIYKVKATVVAQCDTFQLKPVCKPISQVIINFETNEGVMSPVGEALYKNSRSYPLSFNPSSEYQFVEWRVYRRGNLLSDEEKDFITIANPENAITTFQMNFSANNTPDPFEVKPYCIERPIVLNTTPINSNAGCYRDEQITVLFDKDMDESSIYFTEKEIPAGKVTINATREGKTDLIYAYADSVSDDEYGNKIYVNKVYKNIEIKNLANQASLNEYFDEPYFESNTKLVIKTARKAISGGKTESMAPPGSTQIVVTVSKEMKCIVDNISVKLATNKKFNYLTNQFIDIDPPQFANSVQPVVKHTRKGTSKTTKTSINTTSAVYSDMTDSLADSLSMYLCFTDNLSGVDTINMYYKRVFNQNYDSVSETVKASPLTCQFSADKKYGYFGKNYDDSTKKGDPDTIDLSKLNNGDGVYEIYFGVKDVNGNEATSQKYYILKDTTKPSVTNKSFNDDNFSFSCTSYEKFCKINAVYKTKTNGAAAVNTPKNTDVVTNGSKNLSISSFTYNSSTAATVNVVFEIEDLAGNKTTTENYSSWTKLSKPTLSKDAYSADTPPQWAIDQLSKRYFEDEYSYVFDRKFYGRKIIVANPGQISPTGYELVLNRESKGTYPTTIEIPIESTLGYKNYEIYSYAIIDGKPYRCETPLKYTYYETTMKWCLIQASGDPNHKYDGNNLGKIIFQYGVVFDNSHKIDDLESSWRKYDNRDGTSVWNKTSENSYNNDTTSTYGDLTCRTIEDSCGSSGKHYAYNIRKYGSDEAANHIFSFVGTLSTTPNLQFTFTKMD